MCCAISLLTVFSYLVQVSIILSSVYTFLYYDLIHPYIVKVVLWVFGSLSTVHTHAPLIVYDLSIIIVCISNTLSLSDI